MDFFLFERDMLICGTDPRSRFALLSFWNQLDFILHCLNGHKPLLAMYVEQKHDWGNVNFISRKLSKTA